MFDAQMDRAPIWWSVRYLYGGNVEFTFYPLDRTVMTNGELIPLDVLFARAGVTIFDDGGWGNRKGSYARGFIPSP